MTTDARSNGRGDEPVVRVADLCKRRGEKQVLSELSFEITPGRVFGLIGPNGAGKTTTIKTLIGMLAPDSGTTTVFGEPSMEMSIRCRQRIGYLAEDHWLENLPIADLLQLHSHYFESWDWDWCRQLVRELRVVENRPVAELSKGERRKAELAVALAHRPDLLILDDPAIGLDATVRREILWATLEAAKHEGRTVLFTSHILQDVERIVDDVLILDGGRVRLAGELDELKARTRRIVLPHVDAGREPATLPGELSRARHGRDLVVVTHEFSSELERELRHELGQNAAGASFEPLNLEEIFCEIFGESPREEMER